MRQYTDEIQTAKLIELGFEKPKGWYTAGMTNNVKLYINIDKKTMLFNYSIGELIEMLPKYTEIESQQCFLDIYPTKNKWYVNYENMVFRSLAKISEIELIDALYDMIVKLNEEGVI